MDYFSASLNLTLDTDSVRSGLVEPLPKPPPTPPCFYALRWSEADCCIQVKLAAKQRFVVVFLRFFGICFPKQSLHVSLR